MPRAVDISEVSGHYVEQGSAEVLTRDYLEDTSKDWPRGIWNGHWVRLRGGSNDDSIAVVAASTEHRLYFDERLVNETAAPPDVTYYLYEHMHEDAWQALVLTALGRQADVLAEALLVLTQIRDGVSILADTDLDAESVA